MVLDFRSPCRRRISLSVIHEIEEGIEPFFGGDFSERVVLGLVERVDTFLFIGIEGKGNDHKWDSDDHIWDSRVRG